MKLLYFPSQPTHRAIDICHSCCLSAYVDEMREEWYPSGMADFPMALKLICKECDSGRSA